MTVEHIAYLIVFLLWLATMIQGTTSLIDGCRFHQYVRRRIDGASRHFLPNGEFAFQPSATIIMPCKGVDEKLHHTVEMLSRQHYANYEVIFTFESDRDPAHAAVTNWTASWTVPHQLIVAGLASQRSQKIHNLLAAEAEVRNDREVLVFVDSDAEPGADWLGHLIAPLQDMTIAATTGYRWYQATGGIAAGVRCAWNAATTVTLHNERMNFCWGGSTAMRRDRFRSLEIARYWDRALSDDLQMTRAVRDAELRIEFVPQALVTSSDATTLKEFWRFARRQVVITRICVPAIWRWAFLFCLNFMVGGTAAAALAVVGMVGGLSSPAAMWWALAAWASVLLLVGARAVLRQMSLKMALGPRLTGRDFTWDVFGNLTFAGSLHLNLMLASLISRRFVWRNVEYEMISPDETRIVRRFDPAPPIG